MPDVEVLERVRVMVRMLEEVKVIRVVDSSDVDGYSSDEVTSVELLREMVTLLVKVEDRVILVVLSTSELEGV